MIDVNEAFAMEFCKVFEKADFMKKDQICKWVDGVWVCKKYVRDPNYSGYRYIWEEEVKQS